MDSQPRSRTHGFILAGLALALILAIAIPRSIAADTNGPLKIYPANPISFADKNNQPVWLTGISVCCTDAKANGWPWVTHAVIDDLAAHGGNWVHIRLGPFNSEEKPDRQGRSFEAYAKAGEKYDLDRWNPEFWNNLESLIDYAQRKNVYVEIDLIDAWVLEHSTASHDTRKLSPWNKENNLNGFDDGTCSTLTTAPKQHHINWLKKVVEVTDRFDNVLYQVGNETFDCGGQVSQAWEDGVAAIVKNELSERGFGPRLISTNSQKASIESLDAIDTINYHVAEAIDIKSGKPSGINEYNTAAHTSDSFTRVLWQSFTRHTFFHYWRGGDDQTEYTVTMDRIKIFMDFIEQTAFGDYRVLESNLTGIPNQEYLYYDDNGGSADVNLSSAASSTTFSVTWLNPRSGAQSAGGTVNGGAMKKLASPFTGSSVAWLKKISSVNPTSPASPVPTQTSTPDSTPTSTPNPTPTQNPLPTQSPTLVPNPDLPKGFTAFDVNGDHVPDVWQSINTASREISIVSSLHDGSELFRRAPSSKTSDGKNVNQTAFITGAVNDIWKISLWTRTDITHPAGELEVRLTFRIPARRLP